MPSPPITGSSPDEIIHPPHHPLRILPAVAHGLQRLRLKPKSSHGQQVLEWHMQIDGGIQEVEYDDQHHNRTTLVSVLPGPLR